MSMRIGIDIMGGDYAPQEAVLGAIMAQKELPAGIRLVLIGDRERGLKLLRDNGADENLFDLVHTTEVIEMAESPTKAITQKKDSSIAVGFHLLKDKSIDSFISAGNTGAMLVGAMYSVKAIEGVIRPVITSIVPKLSGGMGVLLDVGANADCKPDVLFQFGLLGSLFSQNVYKTVNPKVGLLSIGEEKEKGNLATLAAHQLMADTDMFNFIGNIEGRDFFNDMADVIVCDGFTGNIVLKFAESIYGILHKKNIHDEWFERFNYEYWGGTPILGINAPVIIGHGISSAKAFNKMIGLAREVTESNLISKIKSSFEYAT
jgi:glycerol-3-phosphate acyltransferase PlsX